jgi:hypothetical protein
LLDRRDAGTSGRKRSGAEEAQSILMLGTDVSTALLDCGLEIATFRILLEVQNDKEVIYKLIYTGLRQESMILDKKA